VECDSGRQVHRSVTCRGRCIVLASKGKRVEASDWTPVCAAIIILNGIYPRNPNFRVRVSTNFTSK
jgi:hypothetical protein